MFDLRIYRAAMVPALAALVLLMFSFEPVPNPLQEPVATPEFEAVPAARQARQIVARAPDRAPGSEGDRTIAALKDVSDEWAKTESARKAVPMLRWRLSDRSAHVPVTIT